MAERDERGHFIKGSSGNPSGRKKGVAAIVRALSNDYKDYLNMLDKWARDEALPVKDRRACINDLLNRSMGMPKQSIEGELQLPMPITYEPAKQ